VVEVGPNVTELRPGDYVVATVRRPGSSIYDRIGTYDMTTDDMYYERGSTCGTGSSRSTMWTTRNTS
jgi:threonine dehydrogenase-like Zn-dependent dehydrogenase